MLRTRPLLLTLLFFFYGGVCLSAAFADVGIEASLNPIRAQVGEPMTLTVIVNNAQGSVKTPQLPQFENFRSYSQGRSQEITFVNGEMSSKNVFSFVLIPTTPGKHVLGQIDVVIDGRVFKTGVLEAEVLTASKQVDPTPSRSDSKVVPPSPQSLPAEYLAGQNVFVKAWVDKNIVYVNEPVYLTYTVYTRVSATFKGFEKEPVTTSFWVEEFPPKQTVNRQEKNIGGYRYIVADVRTMALFPTQAGRYTIEPGVMKIDLELREGRYDSFRTDIFGFRRARRPSSVFSRIEPRLFETDPIRIEAKPLPLEGQPSSFNGAVGRYQVEASVDKNEVEEGQPITYRVKVTGEGNLNTIDLPKLPSMEHFKSYDSSSSLNMRKDRLIVEGDKTEETVLIARKAGNYRIPSLAFSYFDPRLERYKTLQTNVIDLSISPSTEEAPAPLTVGPGLESQKVEIIGEDIRHIKSTAGRLAPPAKQFLRDIRFWWLNAGLLGFAVLVFLIKVIASRPRNWSSVRMKQSHGVARKRLKKAHEALKNNDSQHFAKDLSEAFGGYFADKFNLEPGELGRKVLEERLRDRVSLKGSEEIFETLNRIDFLKFSNTQTSEQEMRSLLDVCTNLIQRYEVKKL